ncbi:MAG TPA: HAMP domain-containing sensor histidine kinase [Nitrospirales bacterium]|nr:HAMP domain-containing sensor histidine kinase [Nitrospirales bacterium]
MKRNTLALRLLTLSSVWVVLTLVVVGVLLILLFRSHVERRFDDFLFDQLKGNIAASDISTKSGVLEMTWTPSNLRFHRPLSGWYWQILENGKLVARSRSLWQHTLEVVDPGIGTGLKHQALTGPAGMPLRGLVENVTLPDSNASFTFVVAGPVSNIDQDVHEFSKMLLVTLIALGVGLVGAVFFQIRIGLRPLSRLQQALAETRLGKTARLPESFPGEVQPVVSELNALLDHNAALLDRARTQTANLAHALKNPLTVLTNEARTMEGEQGSLLGEQLKNMTHSVHRYLSRARAAGANGFVGIRTPVGTIAEDLRFSMDHLYKGKALNIHVIGLEEIYFHGDVQDLEEMLGNLIDNACKWAKKEVQIRGERAGDKWRVIVEDDGPGIPEGKEAVVIQRGRRLDEAIPGSGLGLDIVFDIVMLYGGSLYLDRSTLGGVRANLEWPAVDELL